MTQNEKLLKHLKSGKAVTPFTALRVAGSLRLSERMREIAAAGHQIKKEMVKVGRARVMMYWLAA